MLPMPICFICAADAGVNWPPFICVMSISNRDFPSKTAIFPGMVIASLDDSPWYCISKLAENAVCSPKTFFIRPDMLGPGGGPPTPPGWPWEARTLIASTVARMIRCCIFILVNGVGSADKPITKARAKTTKRCGAGPLSVQSTVAQAFQSRLRDSGDFSAFASHHMREAASHFESGHHAPHKRQRLDHPLAS